MPHLPVLAFVLAMASAAVSCGGGSETDAGAAGDTGTPLDGGTPPSWVISIIDNSGAGQQARMAVTADGAPAVAYFGGEGSSAGPCAELGVEDPPDKVMWDLLLSVRNDGAWARETVVQVPLVGVPVGLSLARGPDGSLAAAAMTGAPVAQIRYCGANDVGYFRRTAPGSWTTETAVAQSGEAATGDPASDYGFVVGYWPALAFDAAGNPAIAYKDVHAGGMQADDHKRADLELAWSYGGAWHAIPVDAGRGAGDFSAVAFDGQGRPVVAYYVPTGSLDNANMGVWAARTADQGVSWQRVRLHAGGTQYGISSLVNPGDGSLNIAFYDGDIGVPRLARLVDDAAFGDLATGWEVEEFGDNVYDEGSYPALAIDAQGRIIASYYRCVRASAGLGSCDPNDDAVVFARREAGGRWSREVIDAGTEGLCGIYTSLAVGPDGRIFIAYQCAQGVGGVYTFHLKLAELAPG